jgi:rubrerythrin
MPEFGSPFSGLAKDRKLNHEELIRAIRFMIAAEYEAVQLYMQVMKFLKILQTRSDFMPESFFDC